MFLGLYCKKCKEAEPDDWSFDKKGLWQCSCKTKKIDLDVTLKKIKFYLEHKKNLSEFKNIGENEK